MFDPSLQRLIVRHGMPLVALLVLGGELGLPSGVPLEVALLLAGSYAVHSAPQLLLALGLVTLADVCGTTMLCFIVRTGGRRVLARLLRSHEARAALVLERWRRRLGEREVAIVFVVRLLPLARMYITIAAGLLRLRLRDFLLGATPAALIWAGTPLVLGYIFRADVQRFAHGYALLARLLLLAFPLASVGGVALWWIRRGRTGRAAARRARAALALAAAVVGCAYVADVAWANDRAADRGLAALSFPALAAWLTLLAILSLILAATAWDDLRNAGVPRPPRTSTRQLMLQEVARTLVWIGLVAGLGCVAIVLELRYPAL